MTFISCSNSISNKKFKRLKLDNNIGVIKINLSNDFNSFKKSYRSSDCGCCCASIKYQYYNSKKDNMERKDTIPYIYHISDKKFNSEFSFTISHNACNKCGVKQNDYKVLNGFVESLKIEQPNINFIIDKSEIINDLEYRIIAHKNYFYINNSSYIYENVTAYTIINSQIIIITANRIGKEKSNFIEDIYKMIKTIKTE